MGKYYYKTIAGRKRNDTARNEHIERIKNVNNLLNESVMGTESWIILMQDLIKLETQLSIYDREMGY